ncbi:MAG: hypothetical protein ACLVJ6_13300 [Merdibacter sp.]
MVSCLKNGGTFLTEHDVLRRNCRITPNHAGAAGEEEREFYIIDATKIAQEIGMGRRTNTICSRHSSRRNEIMPYEKAVES